MTTRLDAIVRGKNGLTGVVETFLEPPDEEAESAVIRLEDGRRVVIPADLLLLQADGSYSMELSEAVVEEVAAEEEAGEVVVIPVVAERVEFGKRTVETGRVRIHKTVRTTEQVVEEPLIRDEVEVERVPIGRMIKVAPSSRQEGYTLIIPILEEILVVEKRLMLKEEIRITRRKVEQGTERAISLRSEEVTIERLDENEPKEMGK